MKTINSLIELQDECSRDYVQGNTVSRLRNGRVLHRFQSWLPGGSRLTLCGGDGYCILDCIFHEQTATYFLLDLMCWRGHALYGCNAEFRLFWRDSKLREEGCGNAAASAWQFKFEPVPVHKCSPGEEIEFRFVFDRCVSFLSLQRAFECGWLCRGDQGRAFRAGAVPARRLLLPA